MIPVTPKCWIARCVPVCGGRKTWAGGSNPGAQRSRVHRQVGDITAQRSLGTHAACQCLVLYDRHGALGAEVLVGTRRGMERTRARRGGPRSILESSIRWSTFGINRSFNCEQPL